MVPESESATGLDLTFRTLARSENQTATQLLVAGLDCSSRTVQEKSVDSLLERRDLEGHLALLTRWPELGEYLRQRVCQKGDRLSGALKVALESADHGLFQNACQVAVAVREYSAIVPLVHAAQAPDEQRARIAAQTVLDLAEALYDELAAPRDYRERRDPQRVRQHVTGCLELALARSSSPVSAEIVEAFLLLANPDNSLLRRILEDASQSHHRLVRQVFERSPRAGVFRLLLRYIETSAPSAVLEVIAKRNDVPFLKRLARVFSADLTEAVRRNLRRIERFAWFADPGSLFALTDQEQAALVTAARNCGAPVDELIAFYRRILECAQPAAQRAAVAALADIPGPEADRLVIAALDSTAPDVQAEAIRQIRPRSIPNGLELLLTFVDCPHPQVRAALRESLVEFNALRYLHAFEMLSEEARATVGVLVRKLDVNAIDTLRTELTSPSRMRRLRGLQAAIAMEAAKELQTEILELLEDEDHIIRTEAARALGQARGSHVVRALHDALHDRSVAVQAAAQEALQIMMQSRPSVSTVQAVSPFVAQHLTGNTTPPAAFPAGQ